MKNLKWQKDSNGDLNAFIIKKNFRIGLKVKADNSYSGRLIKGPSFLTSSGGDVVIFTGQEKSATKAILAAERALINYLGLKVPSKSIKKEDVINNKNTDEPKKVMDKPRILIDETINSYEISTSAPVDEIRYNRTRQPLKISSKDYKIYKSPLEKVTGITYSLAAIKDNEIVAVAFIGK